MESIAIIGLGYVGLRAALAFSKKLPKVIGFDINQIRIQELKNGFDHNDDTSKQDLLHSTIYFTHIPQDLAELDAYIIDVQTPADEYTSPNLSAINSACELVGKNLKKGALVVCESTVYPGLTDEIVIPILEKTSGLKSGVDFYVGYSPERIVPGDKTFELTKTTKIISGQNTIALEKVHKLYELIMPGQLFSAQSMAVAEAAKLLENVQRDVNIALINEFAHVMKKMNLSIFDVLDAAGTKWNFLHFEPGFVGGHCIPIDPYYLIHQAKKVGAGTRLIEAARAANESLVHLVIDAIFSYAIKTGLEAKNTSIVVFGISFKKNVADTRHSLSIKLYQKLQEHGFQVVACDPLAFQEGLEEQIKFCAWEDLPSQNIAVLTVGHDEFKRYGPKKFSEKIINQGALFDVPGLFHSNRKLRDDITYWSL